MLKSEVSFIDLRMEFGNLSNTKGSEVNPLVETVKTGEILGQLSSLAKASTEATLDRKLIACLLKERVGTKNMEFEALKLAREAQKKGLGPGGGKKESD